MSSLSHSPLTIYRASAGSGKTYTLAKRYISLLVAKPDAYRHILAVTFTNKATEEMKTRILKDLFDIAHQPAESNLLTQQIAKEQGIAREQVVDNAARALHLLLHDYTAFNVQTIDAFFQKVLRNLAREMGLSTIPRVELNDIGIEGRAVDAFFRNLKANDERMAWVTQFISLRLDEDKDWNVSKEVKTFGEQLFKDDYKKGKESLNTVLSTPGFLKNYQESLAAMKAQHVQTLKQYGIRFMQDLSDMGLSIEDFPHRKTSIAAFFEKLTHDNNYELAEVKSRVKACRDSADKWATKTSPHAGIIIPKAASTWMPMLEDVIPLLEKAKRECKSVDYTLKNIHQLRLLQSIDEEVHRLTEEENCFLLSDTHSLLNSIIYADGQSTSVAPFIFEKIGTRLHHIMIDEFQDTGKLQWENFRVLMEECMGHSGSQNIIVGDVKQSIYRWRAGDWRLLQHIESYLSAPKESIKTEVLERNWRSGKNIIDFNNVFFEIARRQEQEFLNDTLQLTDNTELLTAYNDVIQRTTPATHDGGYVEVVLLGKERYDELTLAHVADNIKTLISNGIAPKDIAILCRKNDELSLVAAYLTKYMPDVPLVARNAFTLDNSLAVCVIIEAMRLLVHPEHNIALPFLVNAYRSRLTAQPEDTIDGEQADTNSGAWHDIYITGDQTARYQLLPEAFIGHEQQLRALPIHDLAENLFHIFRLQQLTDESAYICTFFDQLQTLANQTPLDINGLLHIWDSQLKNEKITTAQDNGIQLLTIHTSKGLQFPYVFMPFTDWIEGYKPNDIVWFHPYTEPFNQLPLIPINPVNGLMDTIYANEYKEEKLQRAIDRLNLLYVGFTRAQHGLFVMGRKDDDKSRSKIIRETLRELYELIKGNEEALQYTDSNIWDLLRELSPFFMEDNVDDKDTPLIFQYGDLHNVFEEYRAHTLMRKERETNPEQQQLLNPFNIDKEPLSITLVAQKPLAQFRQSNDSLRFISGEEEDSVQEHYIRRGRVLHYIFSRIQTIADIDTVIAELQRDGLLSREGLSADETRKMLHSALSDERVAEWFDDDCTILNERSIAMRDADSGQVRHIRPDRVVMKGNETIVIDFKFGKQHDEYHDQVRTYMNYLHHMGYTKIR